MSYIGALIHFLPHFSKKKQKFKIVENFEKSTDSYFSYVCLQQERENRFSDKVSRFILEFDRRSDWQRSQQENGATLLVETGGCWPILLPSFVHCEHQRFYAPTGSLHFHFVFFVHCFVCTNFSNLPAVVHAALLRKNTVWIFRCSQILKETFFGELVDIFLQLFCSKSHLWFNLKYLKSSQKKFTFSSFFKYAPATLRSSSKRQRMTSRFSCLT